jgi:hypothetical protein
VPRRLLYSIIGIVTINLALMVGMYVRMRDSDKCDTGARGLVVWSDEGNRWLTISPPPAGSGLPPCKGRWRSELEVLPG